MYTALENPRLTEAFVISSVLRPAAAQPWCMRSRSTRMVSPQGSSAACWTEHLSLARALEFSQEIPAPLLQEVLGKVASPYRNQDQLLRENV